MEFKGTKGKWAIINSQTDFFYKIVDEKNNGICIASFECKIEERKHNAMLIYKAPEMLEAIQEFCDRVEKGEVRSTKTYNKFKKIIKEVTEI